MHQKISNFLKERIAARDFPSAVYLVAEEGAIIFSDALGFAVIQPKQIEANIGTIYDLASLTKVLVTGLLTAILIEKGEIGFDDKAVKFLKAFNGGPYSEVTIKKLLTHTSGLPAWLPFYLLSKSGDLERVIAGSSPDADQEAVTYSDLNFLSLQLIIEKVIGEKLDIAAEKYIFEPLNLIDTFFAPRAEIREGIAASENGNEYERQTCVEMFPEIHIPESTFRNGIIWGEVHDGNAYFMNGVGGHAGLFSTAEEVFEIAQQFLPNETKLLKPETCVMFCRNFTEGFNEDRSFAFQLASTEDSTSGSKMSPESFGHLGFTGTSLWIDPANERIFILLTNRTHDHPLPFVNINSVRRKFHELAIECIESGQKS